MHRACLDESNVIETVSKGKSGLFWIVFHAPHDATSGIHGGKIRITCDRHGEQGETENTNRRRTDTPARSATEIDLQIRVRPFVLQRARIPFWAYSM